MIQFSLAIKNILYFLKLKKTNDKHNSKVNDDNNLKIDVIYLKTDV
jgi:hypothetical protein